MRLTRRHLRLPDRQAQAAASRFRFRVATHEAGHACAARLLGLSPCGEASCIEPAYYARVPTDQGWRSICAIFAGSIAEGVTSIDDFAEYEGDYELATAELERIGFSDADAIALWCRTQEILYSHRCTIKVVATCLWSAGWLDGKTIDDLVRIDLADCRPRPCSVPVSS